MVNFKIQEYFYFTLLIFNVLLPTPILGMKIRRFADSSEGHTIYRDDYGSSVRDVDCPTKMEDNPKLIYNNASHYSSYFTIFCLARYPTTIGFEGNKAYLPSVRMLVANANPGNMSKACYVLQLTSHFYRDWTSPVGNFTCRGVQNGNKSVSLNVHVQTNWGWRFQNSFNVQKFQTVYINQNSVSRFLISCPANKLLLQNPILKKEEKGTGDETPLQNFAGFKVSYDKYKGFFVDYSKSVADATNAQKPATTTPTTTTSSPNTTWVTTTTSRTRKVLSDLPKVTPVVGKYVCSDPQALATADVTVKHADFLIFPNKTNVTFEGGRLTFECYSNKKVSISVIQPATVLSPDVGTPRTSEFAPLGFIYGAKVTFRTQDPKAIGRIVCQETKTSKHLHEWSFDNGYICKCEWNNTYDERHNRYYYPSSQEEQEFGETSDSQENNRYRYSGDWEYFDPPYYASDLTCYNNKATAVDFVFHHCANPLECEFLRQSCEKDVQNCPNIGTDYYYRPLVVVGNTNRTTRRSIFSPGLIQCTADGYTTNINVTTDWKGDMFFNDNKPKKDEEILHIRAAESHVFTGDKMLYACLAAGAGIAHPIVWGFQFDDGDRSFNYSNYDFEGYQYGDRLQIGYSRSLATMRTTYLTIPSTRKSSNLFCFAPKWDSPGSWAKISVKLNIEDAQVAENPPKCPKESNPIIVMYRNSSSISRNRIRLPHLVTGKDALVFDPVESVSLYCMAKFPVIWFKDGLNITAARVSRANCKNDDGKILARQLYKSTVTFKINSFNATGNYTCRSISPHRSRQTSTYIYAMSPENRTTFVDEGKHHIIKHQWRNYSKDWEQKKWVVLSCRLNSPKLIPYLFLDIPEQERIEKIPYKRGLQYLRFDPKVGFTLDVTYNRVVKGNRTIFFCSDHEDGSFIGTMITLELFYEQPQQNNTLTTTPLPTKSSTSPTPGQSSTTPSTPVPIARTSTEGSRAGFIVTTILLSIFCVACIGIIHHLYQKVRIQRAKPAPQELDWTRAMSHTISSHNGNGAVGNGIGHISTSTHMNAEFIDTPNILESLDNNSLIVNEQIPTIEALINVGTNSVDSREQDRSLSSLSDADFGYKKL